MLVLLSLCIFESLIVIDLIMKPIKVGLLGIGTVGAGTFTVLQRNQAEISARAGRAIQIVMVADLNVERARELTHGECEVVSDGNLVVTHPDIDIVIELIGGYGIAKDLVMKAIANDPCDHARAQFIGDIRGWWT